MVAPEGFPSISVGYETDDDDADAIFAGLTFEEVGPGSVSLGMASTDTDAGDRDELINAARELYGVMMLLFLFLISIPLSLSLLLKILQSFTMFHSTK